MNQSAATSIALLPGSFERSPSRDEISECARKISTDCGLPEVHDGAIWFEAERRLLAARQTPGRFHWPLFTRTLRAPTDISLPIVKPPCPWYTTQIPVCNRGATT